MKQRLLGAAVLLALLVIFVPMFFPGPAEKDTAPAVDLGIPAQPADTLDSRVFELDVPAPEAGASVGAPAGTRASAEPPAATAAEPAAAPPEPVAEAAPDAGKAAPSTPVAKPAAKPATPAPGTAAATRFAVSVGVFASARNADARLAQVKLLGYPAYVEAVAVDGKKAHGVRVGPFDGRASAEAARLRLQGELDGARPALLALGGSLDKDAPAGATSTGVATGWAVQLAAFRDRADAEELRNRVRAAGFEGFIDQTRDAAGSWWRVRAGPRARRADAETLRAAIKNKLGTDGLVVAHP